MFEGLLSNGEIIHQIEDYEGYYVTNFGRLLKFDSVKNIEKELIGSVGKNGYKTIVIYRQFEKAKGLYVHRLVCKYFVKNNDPINDRHVNHIDHNRLNNHYTNLEWCTVSHNIKHCFNSNRRFPINLKFSEEMVKICRDLRGIKTGRDIAKQLGISPMQVSRIQRGINRSKNWEEIFPEKGNGIYTG